MQAILYTEMVIIIILTGMVSYGFYSNRKLKLANTSVNSSLQACERALQEQKNINEQVRKQIFAERAAGEDTINRLYERIRDYKDQISKLTKENKSLRQRSVPK